MTLFCFTQVVDARAGPGIKSLTKFKSKNKKKMKELPEKFEKIMKKKHIYLKDDPDREQSPIMSDDMIGLSIFFSLIDGIFVFYILTNGLLF